MLQLAYMSIASYDITRRETGAISAQAQLNNRADEITGILIGRENRFLQVLEGPKESVENTFLRIMTDPRHHSLMLLSRRLVTAREFGIWDMANCQDKAEQVVIIAQVGYLIRNASDHIRQAFAVWHIDQPTN